MSSFNRRSTRSTAPPPQVTYHQNPARTGVVSQQTFQQAKPGFQQQQQQPTQLTQQQQPLQQLQQQQLQQQQQQQATMQQISQGYKTATPQTPQRTQATVLATKVETITPKQEQDKLSVTSGAVDDMESEAGETRKWQKRPKPQGYKVNKVLKRRRKNARFRKLLTPKNAIMVLNELQPGVAFDTREVTNAFNQTTYVVSFEVDGQQFSGEGNSKGAAKQSAAESAVKSLILKKIAETKRREEAEPMDTAENSGSEQVDGNDTGSTNGGRRRELPEDEVPWGSLASFALYRLFNEWESQGTYVPFPTGAIVKGIAAAGGTPVPAPPKPKVAKSPAPASATHPVTLVGRLWPGSVFSEISREGQPPNMTFVMGVTIDGKQFTGLAKNKKDAKKECAKAALTAMGVAWEDQPAQTA